MGGVFSRMSDYVYSTIEGIRSNIKNRIDNAKNAVFTRVNNVKTGVTTRVTNTKNAVYKVYDDTRTGVVTRVTNVRDGVVNRYTNARDGVLRRYNYVKTKVTNTRDAVVDRYTRTRDYTVTKYTETKTYVHDKYTEMREAKLTRWQKFRYSLLFLFILVCWFISMAILWDLWCGDLDAAADKAHAVWEFACFIASNLYLGTTITLGYTWEGLCVAADYTWTATKFVGFHTKVYGTIAGEYTLYGASVTGFYTWEGIKLIADYLWWGFVLTAENLLFGLKVIAEYLVMGSQLALDYTIYGSKVAGHYIAEGSVYTYEHGSVVAKDLSYRFGKWLIYFFTNFREASYEAGVFLWETSLWTGAHVISGTYAGVLLLIDVTYVTVTTIFTWTVASVTWLYTTTVSVTTATVNTVDNTVTMLKSGSLNLWDLTCQAAEATYEGIIAAMLWTYTWTCISLECIAHWIVTAAEFSWTWGTTIIMNVSHGLYVGVNRFGLKWLYALGNGVVNIVVTIGTIMLSFITEVGAYTGNFIFVAGTHIYNLLYIIFMFVYQIVSALAAVIRSVLKGMSVGATAVFSVVMWITNETIFAYMYMLAKYNRYREMIFAVFVVLMTMYCTGLVRDRRKSAEDEESDSDESEDEADGEKPRSYPSLKELELAPPPGYSSKPVPSYAEANTPENPPSSNAHFSDSDDSEFGLDDRVPDFMDLSGSEGEEESPECDQEVPKMSPGEFNPTQLTPSEDDFLLDDPDSEGHLSSSEGRSEGPVGSTEPSDVDDSDPDREESRLALRVEALKQQKESANMEEQTGGKDEDPPES